MNIFRRLPLSRLLLLCGIAVAAGISITAIALALGTGSKPPPRPLAEAIHDALAAPSVQGFSADVKLTNHLFEGANLAAGNGEGGGLSSNPLIAGASGRLWVSGDGRVRLELQAEQGDTQILYDGHTLEAYDAASNTLYRFASKDDRAGEVQSGASTHEESAYKAGWTSYAPLPSGASEDNSPHKAVKPAAPSIARIEKAIAQARKHAVLPEAIPANVGGRPAYTLHVQPKEGGSLIGGAELSFDAETGVPLRTAIYSTNGSSPVIELATSNVSYRSVPDSVFAFSAPGDAKVVELGQGGGAHEANDGGRNGKRPHVTQHGKGLSSVFVLESHAKGDSSSRESDQLEGLPKVDVNGVKATELRTDLGTLLSYEREGVRYVVAGAVAPEAIEALARGL